MSIWKCPSRVFRIILPVSLAFCHCQRSRFTGDFSPRPILPLWACKSKGYACNLALICSYLSIVEHDLDSRVQERLPVEAGWGA